MGKFISYFVTCPAISLSPEQGEDYADASRKARKLAAELPGQDVHVCMTISLAIFNIPRRKAQ